MELKLKNPIVFFDLETTGINIAEDRIVELSYLKVYPNGKEEVKTFKINPTIPIPPQASAIHGIKDEDIKEAPTFAEVAKTLAKEFEGCDFAGYNLHKFDVPLLAEEFLRANQDFDFIKRKIIDVQVIFHKMEQRTLSAAYKFYCKKDLSEAHSAEADTLATYEVLKAQLETYKDTEYKNPQGKITKPIVNDMEKLAAFSSHTKNADLIGRIIYNEKNEEVFNFGKYKGKKVEEILSKDPGYYGWMMNGDFPLYTKKVLTAIKLRAFNK